MREARRHPRIGYRLAVDVFCGNETTRRQCHTQDIGLGGLFAVGGQCLQREDEVQVELGPPGPGTLHLTGRVARVNANGAGVQFVGNSAATIEVLTALIEPKWDGQNLLDGIISIAPWYRQNDLAGWMRLTSLVSDWQKLTQH
ncbi:MAG: PilZ domain-containing protein [Gammaproteobacteria bacterium]|nr:PilZ domain-containing protein [Gammaproteobacteria bacterium]